VSANAGFKTPFNDQGVTGADVGFAADCSHHIPTHGVLSVRAVAPSRLPHS
jgi:hypothetical protein